MVRSSRLTGACFPLAKVAYAKLAIARCIICSPKLRISGVGLNAMPDSGILSRYSLVQFFARIHSAMSRPVGSEGHSLIVGDAGFTASLDGSCDCAADADCARLPDARTSVSAMARLTAVARIASHKTTGACFINNLLTGLSI